MSEEGAHGTSPSPQDSLIYPVSPPNGVDRGACSTKPLLTLAMVRERAKRRTAFALRVIEASKAALKASDALLAATDALVATDDDVYKSNKCSAPEAWAVSDTESSETESASDHRIENVQTEPADLSHNELSKSEVLAESLKGANTESEEWEIDGQDDSQIIAQALSNKRKDGCSKSTERVSRSGDGVAEHIIQQALSTEIDGAHDLKGNFVEGGEHSDSDVSSSSSEYAKDNDEEVDNIEDDEEESEMESTTNNEEYSEGDETDDHVKLVMNEAQTHSLIKDTSLSRSIVSGTFDIIPTAIDAPPVLASGDSVAANSMDDTSKANNLKSNQPDIESDSDLSSAGGWKQQRRAQGHERLANELKAANLSTMSTFTASASPAAIAHRTVEDDEGLEVDESSEEPSTDGSDSVSGSWSGSGFDLIEESEVDVSGKKQKGELFDTSNYPDVEADVYVIEQTEEVAKKPQASVPQNCRAHADGSTRPEGLESEHVEEVGGENESMDDSESGSSQSSGYRSSSGRDSESGEEDSEEDEYVDSLLQEVKDTRPSSLVPKRGTPGNQVATAETHFQPQRRPSQPAEQSPGGSPPVSAPAISGIQSAARSDVDSSIEESDEEDFSESDGHSDSRSNDTDYSSDVEGANHTSSEEVTSEEEDDDEYVDNLLQELRAPKTVASKVKPLGSPAQPPPLSAAGKVTSASKPMQPVGAPPLPSEGLNLEAIRSELEKVGRAVMTQKSGEAFVARARVLGSINQLSSHVPNCVLDFLGNEIRAHMAREVEKAKQPKRTEEIVDAVSTDGDMSEVSELSEADMDTLSGEENEEEDSAVGFFVDTSDMPVQSGKDNDPKLQPDKTTPALMRRKSEEALDEMFKKSQDGTKTPERTSSDEALENIFTGSNQYGFSKASDEKRLVSTMSQSESRSLASSMSNNIQRKPRSRSVNSAGSITWGYNIEGKLPSVSRFECALLFVDISGFTKLSTLLDPETLSKVINSYFQLIVSKIYEFNGDIQKFAGDAIFAEWRICEKHSKEFCVAAAAACATQIVNECSDFPVMANGTPRAHTKGEAISSLNVHCALGAGQMIGIHVGDHTRRREYLFLGEPIDQLTWGADLAKHGEFVVSPEAFRFLSSAGVLDFSVKPSESEPAIIAKRDVAMFKSEFLKEYRVSQVEYARSRGVTNHVEGLEVDDLKIYQKLMALYVHPVVAAIHMDTTSKIKSKSSAQERHREEAELRRVYIMFIHPLIAMTEENEYAVETLNEIMNLTSTQLERYSGHLRQMIVDDKGLVLIGTFGLRGSTFPNMVSERALPATIALHNALQTQLGVDNRIGATFGEVYCGAVGGVKRHEYAVLGPSANLAARLMGSKNNPGILVDCAIRRMASRKYAFNALPPVKAKGYSEPVPIFEPLSPLERSWGRIQPNFVGREQEIKALMGMARDIVTSPTPHSRLVFVASQSGMGKSTMIAHAIEHIRNLIGDNARRLVITKHVGKASHSLLPFGMFRSILLNVLANFAASTDDKSHASGTSGLTSQSLSLHSLSCKSQGSSTALSLAKSEGLLKVLCRELNTPSGFVDHLLHHLNGKGTSVDRNATGKAPSMKSMVSFLSRAFIRCTQETKLVVVALDDVHQIDEMSWKVLRQVFEGTANVLMICAFDLSRSRDLKVESDFWQVLNTKYRPSGHFVPIELGGLGKEEITQMTMKTLGLQREEISSDLLNEVLIQSGGMPHFANEFLEMIKRRHFAAMMEGGDSPDLLGLQTGGAAGTRMGSVPEIILHRIDSFDVAVRNTLNIGAVLGKSFTLKEVTAVLKENHDMKEEELQTEASESLDMAIAEGILRMEENPEEAQEDDDLGDKSGNASYTFYHSIWQTTILSLMLDSRKRDVHRKIALSMEARKDKKGDEFAFQMKLLGHWKASGNTAKLTELAIQIGKHFEEKLGLPTQSIRIYEEALEAWKDKGKQKDRIGGIGVETLDKVEEEDLRHMAALNVALGQAYKAAQRNAESAICYHDALRILHIPKASAKISDRSVVFPAYHGLILSTKAGHIVQDDDNVYEKVLLKKFIEESKAHHDKFHYVHAITWQVELFRRYGEMPKALAIHSILFKLYNYAEHSKKLKQTYGNDEAALSFSNSAMWHLQLGNKEAALNVCRFVIGKLMPKMDRSDVHQAFVMMYPVVLVMKDTGVAVQARKHFERLVVQPFGTYFGEGKSSFFLPVYEPIMMLLHLEGFPDLDEDTLAEYTDWALDRDRLCFGTLANRRLAALGRCADSLSAEICFLLAERNKNKESKHKLIENGKMIGEEALSFNTEHGLKMAAEQVENLLSKYQQLILQLGSDKSS